MSHRWEFLPTAILRSTGFPWEAVAALDMPADCANDENQYLQAFEERRRHLYRMAASPSINDAVFLCSPDMDEALQRAGSKLEKQRNTRVKYFERSLTNYLQRVATKNDTNSFFGPINYGRLNPAERSHVRIAFRPGNKLAHREGFISFWGAKVLAAAISREPELREHLRPRLSPLVRRTEGALMLLSPREQVLPMPAAILRITEVMDRKRTLAEVIASFGSEAETKVRSAVDKLIERGLVLLELDLPRWTERCIDYMLDFLETVPACAAKERWTAEIGWFRSKLQTFSAGDLVTRREIMSEVGARLALIDNTAKRRGGGSFYADRLPIYEEALGDVAEFDLGAPFIDALHTELVPIQDLLATQAQLRRLAMQAWASDLVRRHFPGRDRIPLPLVIDLLEAEGATFDANAYGPLMQFEAEWRSFLQDHLKDGKIQVPTQALKDWLTAYPMPSFAVTSPDVMLEAESPEAAAKGDYRLVLGEIHGGVQVLGCLMLFYPPNERRELMGTVERILKGAPTTPVEILASVRVGKGFHVELPCHAIEYRGTPARRDELVLPASDIDVCVSHDELALWSISRAEKLELIWQNGGPFLDTFSIDVRKDSVKLGAYTPRIEIGRVIFQRERWDLPTEELLPYLEVSGAPVRTDVLAQGAALRQRFGWGERVFARFDTEGKPVMVDFNSHYSLELFHSLLKKSHSVTLSEMMPDVANWWLQRPKGRYTSEIRLTAFCCGGDQQ